MIKLICLVTLILISCVALSRAGNMDLSLGLELGGSASVGDCGAGFEQLIGADANAVLDNLGVAICCPE